MEDNEEALPIIIKCINIEPIFKVNGIVTDIKDYDIKEGDKVEASIIIINGRAATFDTVEKNTLFIKIGDELSVKQMQKYKDFDIVEVTRLEINNSLSDRTDDIEEGLYNINWTIITILFMILFILTVVLFLMTNTKSIFGNSTVFH